MSDFSEFDFDFESIPNQEQELPDWVEFTDKGKNKVVAEKMYRAVIRRRDAIIKGLQNGQNLTGRARQIVKSQIAAEVDRQANYLAERSFPNLVRFVAETNELLDRIKPVGVSTGSKNKLPKGEANAEVERLKEALRVANHAKLASNPVLTQISTVNARNIRLTEENETLRNETETLRKENRDLTEQIVDLGQGQFELKSRISELERMVKELGGDPNPPKNPNGLKLV